MKNILKKLGLSEVPGRESCLQEAIGQLPPDNRKAIELHFIEGISRKQIAEQLCWSISKVNQKITRGITLLKFRLDPAYFAALGKIRPDPAVHN